MTEQTNLPVLLNTKDVCDILKVDRTTIYALEIRGKFPPAMRVGAQKRWRLADIEAYIEKGVQEGGRRN